MKTTLNRFVLIAAVSAFAAVPGLSACSSDAAGNADAPTEAATTLATSTFPVSGATATRAARGEDKSDLVNQYVPGAPVATANGKVANQGARIEILSLVARKSSTEMQYRVMRLAGDPWEKAEPWAVDTVCASQVNILDPGAKKVYGPAFVRPNASSKGYGCLVPRPPMDGTAERPLYEYSYYGALPEGVTSVKLQVKGFEEVDIPVTRK